MFCRTARVFQEDLPLAERDRVTPSMLRLPRRLASRAWKAKLPVCRLYPGTALHLRS